MIVAGSAGAGIELWQLGSEVALNLLTAIALVVGGVWGFMKFVWGRTFRERLEVGVTGSITGDGGTRLLHAVLEVANVGLAKVPLQEEGSGLRILAYQDHESVPKGQVLEADWSHVATVSVLSGHDWIEPGEKIYDHLLFGISDGPERPLQLELRLVSDKHQWLARCVLLTDSTSQGVTT